MGFRDYNPGLNRFLTRDTYTGALADLHLGTDPYTGNRYALGGGNPITGVELDGHLSGAACGPDGTSYGMTDYDTSGSYTPGPATGDAVGGTASDGRPAQLGVSAGDAASIYGARDSEQVQRMERVGGGPLASAINIYAGKGLDAAIADARNLDLAPWQRGFAAAAHNALHAGLATGALQTGCYGRNAICPTDPSTSTPSDVLLPTPPGSGSGSFDAEVTVATFSVAVWSLDRLAASGQAPDRAVPNRELTRAGLVYDKHMKRGQLPSVPRNTASLNAAGEALLEDLDPSTGS